MTESSIVFTDESDSTRAGRALGVEVKKQLNSHAPDALILFASSRYDYESLLRAVSDACRPQVLVGCSSAGEFVSNQLGQGSASALALRSREMSFAAGIGHGLRTDRKSAAREITSSFKGLTTNRHLFRSALILTDALAGYTDDLIDQLNVQTAGNYRFFGGGAGDDAQFNRTHVFYGTEAFTDAAVALEILSNKPVAIGVSHGWLPASDPLRVTESDGARLISLNAISAVEVFQEHAEKTGQLFELTDPVPFFLHNVLGIDTGNGFKLRVPLAVNEDGSVGCASDIPTGVTVRIMSTSAKSASDAAINATKSALQQSKGAPNVALFFDCVATRLRMGAGFGAEMEALKQTLGTVPYVGCNTYGQIARAEGQFSGFHNCTATVALIPS